MDVAPTPTGRKPAAAAGSAAFAALWVGAAAADVGCAGAEVGCAAGVGALCAAGAVVGFAAAAAGAVVGAALGVGAWQAASRAMPAAEPNMRSAKRRLSGPALACERVNVPVLPKVWLCRLCDAAARVTLLVLMQPWRWPIVTWS